MLFDPNIAVTWNKFKSPANQILSGLQAAGVLERYNLVMDVRTNTRDLIDRNMMYAKVYLQFSNVGKYFAVDFILTRDGAAFEG
jgi:hypothetical protein